MKKNKVDKGGVCSGGDGELESTGLKKKEKKRKSGSDEIETDPQKMIQKKKRKSEEAAVGSTDKTKSSEKNKKSKSGDFEGSIGIKEAASEPTSTVKKKKRKTKEETCSDKSDVPATDNLGSDNSPKKKKEKKSKREKGVDSVDQEQNSDANNDTDKTTSSSEKKQKKKKAKKSERSASPDDDEAGSRIDRALDYLRIWQNDRKGWKFEKVKQIILLNSMYDVNKLPEADFEILLSYLDGLVGKGREKTLEEAEKKLNIMDEAEKEDQNEEEYERIRRVIQVLS